MVEKTSEYEAVKPLYPLNGVFVVFDAHVHPSHIQMCHLTLLQLRQSLSTQELQSHLLQSLLSDLQTRLFPLSSNGGMYIRVSPGAVACFGQNRQGIDWEKVIP